MSSSRDHRASPRMGWRALGLGALLLGAALTASAQALPGVGRPATAKEIQAWDIDVRPDFKGLPKGSGSVERGMAVWETQCASCHGVFGEANEVFSPLIGGTTADDVKTGRVARLLDRGFPGRTTLMKVPTVSTLWDYIHRAMPWNAPKSLKPDDVYAVTAFLLNLGGVLPDDFVMSDANIAQVQARMPNRNGMTTDHAMWPGKTMGNAAPDVKAAACMNNCATEPKLASYLPEHARNAHGNLMEQNRLVGAQIGADTTQPPGTRTKPHLAEPAAGAAAASAMPKELLAKSACIGCHALDAKLVGPSFQDIAAKYASKADATAYLTGKIKSGGMGVWGQIPMPAQSLSDDDAKAIAQWLAAGAKP